MYCTYAMHIQLSFEPFPYHASEACIPNNTMHIIIYKYLYNNINKTPMIYITAPMTAGIISTVTILHTADKAAQHSNTLELQ